MANETCMTCKFFESKTPNEQIGNCRRYAPGPTANHYAPDHVADWPKVMKHDWCGDHTAQTTQEQAYAG